MQLACIVYLVVVHVQRLGALLPSCLQRRAARKIELQAMLAQAGIPHDTPQLSAEVAVRLQGKLERMGG